MWLFIHLLVCVRHDSKLFYGPLSAPAPPLCCWFTPAQLSRSPLEPLLAPPSPSTVRADNNKSGVGVVRLLISDWNWMTVLHSDSRSSRGPCSIPGFTCDCKAAHGRPTWGTRGAKAASLRVTSTSSPLDAPVVSGGKLHQIPMRCNCRCVFPSDNS